MRGKTRLTVVFCIFLLACQKKGDYSTIRIIGHAGMGLENENSFYHDNSLEAIELALSIEGCDGVEVDVQRAKDGSLWLYHDDKLESQSNGVGCIPEKSAIELEQLTYSTINHEKLIQLQQLPWERLNNKRLFLDIRHYNSCNSTVLSADEFISSLNQILPTNFDYQPAVILNKKQWVDSFENEGYEVFLHFYPDTDNGEDVLTKYPNISGVVMRNSDGSKADVKFWQSKGKKVVIFEMRSPKGIRKALEKYPNEVITDDVRATIIEKY